MSDFTLFPLFRKQAVEQLARRLEGDIILASPLSLKVMSGAILAFFSAALVLASSTGYSRHVVATGWIIPSGGITRITAPVAGTVESIEVREGQQMVAGAAVLRLSRSTEGSPGNADSVLAAGAIADSPRNFQPVWSGDASAPNGAGSHTKERFLITSPMGGLVVAIFPARGDAVDRGDTIGVLSRKAGPLFIELYLPSALARNVRAGQEVRLRYFASDRVSSQISSGLVSSVSGADQYANDAALPGISVKGRAVRVNVQLGTTGFSPQGRPIPITSGMRVSAEIVTGRQSILSWILGPLATRNEGQ